MSLIIVLIAVPVLYGLAFGASFAEGCSPEGIYRLNYDCSKFDLCTAGRWSRMACSEGETFDPFLNKCQKSTGCLGCEKKISDPDNCRGFFTCEGSQRIWSSCNANQIFDSEAAECVKMQPWEKCNGQTTDGPGEVTSRPAVPTIPKGKTESTFQTDSHRPDINNSTFTESIELHKILSLLIESEPATTPQTDNTSPEPTTTLQPDNPTPEPTTTPQPDNPSPEPPTTPQPDNPSSEPNSTPQPDNPSPEPTTTPQPDNPSPEPTTTPQPDNPSPEPTTTLQPDNPSPEPTTTLQPDNPSPEPTTAPLTETPAPVTNTSPSTPLVTTKAPTTVAPTPPPLVTPCRWGQRIPNIYNCKQYFRCNIFRRWVSEECLFFFYFDAVSQRCVLWNPRCAGINTPFIYK